MTYTIDVDDFGIVDNRQNFLWFFANGENAFQTFSGIRRPITHSAARGVEQFVDLEGEDIVVHLDISDESPWLGSTSHRVMDGDGFTYSIVYLEEMVFGKRVRAILRRADTRAGWQSQEAYFRCDKRFSVVADIDLVTPATGPALKMATGKFGDVSATGKHVLGYAVDGSSPPMIIEDSLVSPTIVGQNDLALAFWLNATDAGESNNGYVFDQVSRWALRWSDASTMEWLSRWSSTNGTWTWDFSNYFGGWIHMLVDFQNINTVGGNPLVWINGVSQTVTETSTPAGTIGDDSSGPDATEVGNNAARSRNMNATIDDIRVFHTLHATLDSPGLALGLYTAGAMND